MRSSFRLLALWSFASACVFVDPDDATIASAGPPTPSDSGISDTDDGSGSGSGDEGGDSSGDSSGDDGGTDDGSDDGGTDDGGTGTTPCTTRINETYPTSRDSGWFYRSPLQVVLSEVDTSTELTVSREDGTPVRGSIQPDDDGLRVIFKPDRPLAPSTNYTFDVSVCSGANTQSVAFTTGAIGAESDCDPAGFLYRLEFREPEFVGPGQAAGEQFLPYIENHLLVMPLQLAGAGIDIATAPTQTEDARQDYCAATSQYESAPWSNPGFDLEARDIQVELAGTTTTMAHFEFHGGFSPECEVIQGQISAQFDVRDMIELLAPTAGSEDPFAICTTLESFGLQCEDCRSDTQPFCIPIEDAVITGGLDRGELICVAADDCHPACESNRCSDPERDGVCEW